jgi:histidinol-phosphatase (PHP family)
MIECMELTGDGHVHTQWSWDTGGPDSDTAGRMELMCRPAVQIGLPALAFTEHLDFTSWTLTSEDHLPHSWGSLVNEDRVLTPPPLDVDGYLDNIERCRREFPDLHILSGVEFGQPRLDETRARQLIDLDALDRVNGSLHTIPTTNEPASVRYEPYTLYYLSAADDVVRRYLAEMTHMIATEGTFAVITHIEYAARYWPIEREGSFNPKRFEDEVSRGDAGDRRHRQGARAQHRDGDSTVDPRPGSDGLTLTQRQPSTLAISNCHQLESGRF